MEYRKLGSLNVSLVGVGCNNFGMRCDAAKSAAVVGAALDCGINLFDTADAYGGTKSEEYLGQALKGHRDDVLIATKFAAPIDADPLHRGASARWVAEAVEGSLRRLGTDRIDLYQQHMPDPTVPIEETQAALDQLVRDGKVREIGNSNFSGEQIAAAAALAAAKGWAPFVSAQNHLNLLNRSALKDVIPACEQHGVGMLPYFPLASGMLTGKYVRGEAAPEGTRLAAWPEERTSQIMTDRNFDRVEALSGFAAARDHTLLELAFAWLAHLPTMASIIAGATSPQQVEANAAALSWQLTNEDMDAIQAILDAGR
jgi:aryl-alcohol dehydrogenase-like predicted oxidoreductase